MEITVATMKPGDGVPAFNTRTLLTWWQLFAKRVATKQPTKDTKTAREQVGKLINLPGSMEELLRIGGKYCLFFTLTKEFDDHWKNWKYCWISLVSFHFDAYIEKIENQLNSNPDQQKSRKNIHYPDGSYFSKDFPWNEKLNMKHIFPKICLSDRCVKLPAAF